MHRWIWACAVVFLCVPFTGCKKQANDQDAIRATIEKRLSGRSDLNLSAMDHEVKQISVNGDHANAQVEFRLKGSDAKMEFEYTLERQNKEWAVTSSQPTGGAGSHTGVEQTPSNAPDAGGGSLPQGHPR